jgi:hypothetical protein
MVMAAYFLGKMVGAAPVKGKKVQFHRYSTSVVD